MTLEQLEQMTDEEIAAEIHRRNTIYVVDEPGWQSWAALHPDRLFALEHAGEIRILGGGDILQSTRQPLHQPGRSV